MMTEADKYLPELMAEKDSIDPSFVHAVRLISQEIEKLKNPPKPEPPKKDKILYDVVSGRPSKVECDIRVPAEDFPNMNFVGRLIGPGGATMKGIQEVTNTRMAVLGKGSVRERDRKKVEESKGKEDKFAHLQYPLHVHISALGPLPQAYINLGRACMEIQKLLQIDEETEAQFAAAQGMAPGMGRGRGGMTNPGFGRGRGGPNMRGAPRGRGGFQRGAPSAGRGAASTGRGSMGGNPRGAVRGGGMRGTGRGQTQQNQFNKMKAQTESYAEDYGYDTYSNTGAGAAATGYDASGYGEYDESYDTSYDASYSAESAAYGEGGYNESYDEFGYSGESYDAYGNGAAAQKALPSYSGGRGNFQGKMGGRGNMRGRQKPY